jgi:hypothetical protein
MKIPYKYLEVMLEHYKARRKFFLHELIMFGIRCHAPTHDPRIRSLMTNCRIELMDIDPIIEKIKLELETWHVRKK